MMTRYLLLALAFIATPAVASVQASVSPDVWASLKFCSADRRFHFKTTVCPVPLPPAPAPAPAPVYNYMDGLQPSWGTGAIPASAAPDVVGAFRFIMHDAGTNSDDAVVGLCGTSHLHQYYGRKGWNCRSTYDSMRASVGLLGNDFNGALAVNGSGYWTPAMLDADGNVVKPAFVSGYYKELPASDPKCGGLGTVFGAEGKCAPLPNGIRMIVGWNSVTGLRTGRAWFNCQNGPVVKTAVPGTYPDLNVALANCPTGNLIGEIIEFPDCWNGKDLDSPDHRSHVSDMARDQNSGQLSCDAAHPVVIPKLTLGQWYPVAAGMHLSSDAMVPGAAPGFTAHADYFENWDPIVKAMWTDNCINKMLNCSGGDLGNGLQLKGAQ